MNSQSFGELSRIEESCHPKTIIKEFCDKTGAATPVETETNGIGMKRFGLIVEWDVFGKKESISGVGFSKAEALDDAYTILEYSTRDIRKEKLDPIEYQKMKANKSMAHVKVVKVDDTLKLVISNKLADHILLIDEGLMDGFKGQELNAKELLLWLMLWNYNGITDVEAEDLSVVMTITKKVTEQDIVVEPKPVKTAMIEYCKLTGVQRPEQVWDGNKLKLKWEVEALNVEAEGAGRSRDVSTRMAYDALLDKIAESPFVWASIKKLMHDKCKITGLRVSCAIRDGKMRIILDCHDEILEFEISKRRLIMYDGELDDVSDYITWITENHTVKVQ